MHTGLYTTYKNISERVLRIIDADSFDDSDANVKAVQALSKKYPKIKLVAKRVKI